MGRVILCETVPATTSYIFPNTKIEVFSYEELCYYMYNNIALVSEEYIGVAMFHWIEQELHLPDLADSLRALKEKETTLVVPSSFFPLSSKSRRGVSPSYETSSPLFTLAE